MSPSAEVFGFQMPQNRLDFLTSIMEIMFLKILLLAVSRLVDESAREENAPSNTYLL